MQVPPPQQAKCRRPFRGVLHVCFCGGSGSAGHCHARSWRCPDCRVALWSKHGGARDLIRFVRVGTLDRPGRIAPDVHIYSRSTLPWVRLPEGVPAFAAYYDSAKLWPAASLERRNQALGRG